jgi:hypothetical protein
VSTGAVDEFEVGLMDQHRGVDRLAGPDVRELTGVELGVDEAEDEVDRAAISLADLREEPGDLTARVAVRIGSAHSSSAVAPGHGNYSCRERLLVGLCGQSAG